MSRPRFGIGLRGDRIQSEYGRLARLAERLSFDVISVFGDLGYQAPLGPLLEIAAATERVTLGPCCLNPFTTHPAEIAGQVAAVDSASSGRSYLGLARGAWLSSIGVAQPRPVLAIREAAEVVARLLAADDSGYQGEIFSVEPGFRLRFPITRSRVPLLIGAWGERTVALAGEIAGELKVGGSANAEIVPVMRSRMPGSSTGIVLGAVTVVDEDGGAARERARSEVAMYFELVARLDPTLDVPDGLLRDIGDLLRSGDQGAAGGLIPEHLLDRFAFSGTPREVTAQVRAIFDAGAARVEFGAPFGLDSESGLRLLGERVLPEFR